MRTEINNVSTIVLQEQLDQEFGLNVFTAVVDLDSYKFYIDCSDDINSELLTRAVEIANKETNRKFTETRSRLYDQIERMSDKTINRYRPTPPTITEFTTATNWLANTSQACPTEILKKSILEEISTVDAAQSIINSYNNYQNFLTNVATMKDQTLRDLLVKTSIAELKSSATTAINYFNSLEQQFQD